MKQYLSDLWAALKYLNANFSTLFESLVLDWLWELQCSARYVNDVHFRIAVEYYGMPKRPNV